jgi:hypothetical protein
MTLIGEVMSVLLTIERTELVWRDATCTSGISFLIAFRAFSLALRITLVFWMYPVYPIFIIAAHVPAITDPGLLPAMVVVV